MVGFLTIQPKRQASVSSKIILTTDLCCHLRTTKRTLDEQRHLPLERSTHESRSRSRCIYISMVKVPSGLPQLSIGRLIGLPRSGTVLYIAMLNRGVVIISPRLDCFWLWSCDGWAVSKKRSSLLCSQRSPQALPAAGMQREVQTEPAHPRWSFYDDWRQFSTSTLAGSWLDLLAINFAVFFFACIPLTWDGSISMTSPL